MGFPFPEFACAGGGVPIWIKGNEVGPVGAIIVSGLPQREDHQVSLAASSEMILGILWLTSAADSMSLLPCSPLDTVLML